MKYALLSLSLLVGSTGAFALGGAGSRTVLTCHTSRAFQQIHVEVKRLTGLTGGKPGSFIETVTVDGKLAAVGGVEAFQDANYYGYSSRKGDLGVKISRVQLTDIAFPFARGTVFYKKNGRLVNTAVMCNTRPDLGAN